MKQDEITRTEATLEMVFAGLIWGFGFIATIWALESLGPYWITAVRFIIALLVCLPFVLKKSLSRSDLVYDLKLTFVPGILMALVLGLQTAGLRFTTATKSSFITALYVIFVPLIEISVMKRKFHPLHFLAVAGGIVGMGLMTGFINGEWNRGDTLTFVCAIVAAIHIVVISWVNPRIKSTFRFNTGQSFWAGVLALIVAFFYEPIGDKVLTNKAIWGIFVLAVGSTAIAFFLQVRAQKVLSASTASMLFLLEAPFASVFALFLLNEHLSGPQVIGGSIILMAAGLANWVEAKKTLPPTTMGHV